MKHHKRNLWICLLALWLAVNAHALGEDGTIMWVIDAQMGATATIVERTPMEADMMREEDFVELDDEYEELILVNAWNSLPEDYSVRLKEMSNGQAVDERAYSALLKMLADAQRAGLSPLVCSSYRTIEKQQSLFSNRVQRCLQEGYGPDAAETEAAKWVARPGASEHHTGLAVDIVALSYQLLDEGQERTPEQQWLMKNCWKYGFILRYPNGKSDWTGIYYEPWHYRFVGKRAAKEIMEQGICLEEYLKN